MKLKDIIEEYISGDWGNEDFSPETPCAVYCVRGADIVPISNDQFNDIPLRYVSKRTKDNKTLRAGDLVIEKSGGSPVQSTGRITYISQELIDSKQSVVCSNFCTSIRIKDSWNSKFIYYYWQYIYNSGVFFNFEGKTSGLKNLQFDNAIASIDIPEYTLEQQTEIADILSKLESKMTVNREINRNLEAMARQLYDYWFVQFDFPDENGKPYKSSGGKMVWNDKLRREIPEGWITGSLPDIAAFTNGIACQKFRPENNIDKLPVIKIREMRDGITEECEWVKSDIPDSVRVQNGDILFSWSASLEVMIWCNGEGGLNQHIFKVTSKNDYPQSYIFFQILDYIGVFKSIAEARKTTMGHITQDHLNQSAIVLPDSSCVLTQFEKRVAPIFQQYVANNVEISLLKKKRDELLPLLMNGQVSVMQPELNCDLSHD